MAIRGLKKMAVGAALSAALVGGGAMITPGIASAAPGSSVGVDTGSLGTWDTGSLGIGANAPKMAATQSEGKITVKMTNPDNFVGVCAPALLQMDQAVRLLADPGKILDGGAGITLFAPNLINGTWGSIGKVENGIYALVGVCAGLPVKDTAIQVMVVPGTGIGSVESGVAFGSVAGSAALEALMNSLNGS